MQDLYPAMATTALPPTLPPPYDPELDQNDSPPQYTQNPEPLAMLPGYDCSVDLESRTLLKVEFTRPFAFSNDRSWRRIRCQIHGTSLQLSTDRRTRCLSLQAADAGLAPDYRKRANVIRLRVEGYQFLLALPSTASCLEWLEKLHAAIAISLPLDEWIEGRQWFSMVPKDRPPMYSTLGQYMKKQWRERPSHPSQVWLKAGLGQHYDYAVVEARGGFCHCRKDLDSPTSSSSDTATANSDDKSIESKSMCNEAKWESEHDLTCVHFETDFAQRCARWLLLSARWKYGWYYSDGERVGIGSTACLPGRHALLCPCSQCKLI